jgi:type IV pilus biogenesis protein CpaD/CtpE
LTLSFAATALLGGCTANDTTLGDSLRTDIALQVADPDPAAHTNAAPGDSGVQAARASEAYRKGTVKPPVSIQTTSKSGGSGSSAGSSGGGGPN